MSAVPDLQALNRAAEAEFAAALGPLFESAPRFLARLAAGRPYQDWTAFFGAAHALVLTVPVDEQVELLNAHPRLGAAPASLSSMSFREQGYEHVPTAVDASGAATGSNAEPASTAAVAPASDARIASKLAELNGAYEVRFGFRYCVHVAGRSRAELLPGFRDALEADRDEELRRALGAVVDIARARLAELQGGAA